MKLNKKYGCPIGCKYCVITEVDCRRTMWEEKTLIGLNRAVTILNPPPDLNDQKSVAEFYNFPLELLRGDIVGFNAISDPFWPKYSKELDYFLEKVAPIAKLVVCVTKFNISDAMLIRLSKIPNFRLTVSITGLDTLEGTKTKDRLDLLARAKRLGVKAFPIVHPYIAGMSDLAFLPKLKKLGYDFIDVKGFRYNEKNMGEWLSETAKEFYNGTNEQETLPIDGWLKKVLDSGLKIKSLKTWYSESLLDNFPCLSERDSVLCVDKILSYANITSSSSNKEVIRAAIRRRL